MNLSTRVVTVYNEHTHRHTQGVSKMGGNAIHVSEKIRIQKGTMVVSMVVSITEVTMVS